MMRFIEINYCQLLSIFNLLNNACYHRQMQDYNIINL